MESEKQNSDSDSTEVAEQERFFGQLGGRRPGAGRPRGSISQETKLRQASLREYRSRVSRITDNLLNAQLANALGNVHLIKVIDTIDKKTGKSLRRRHVIVEDVDEIVEFLDQAQGEDSGYVNENYYYMTTRKPDTKAIDSILDRTYGKAQASIDLSSKGEKIKFVSTKTEEALNGLFDEENIIDVEAYESKPTEATTD